MSYASMGGYPPMGWRGTWPSNAAYSSSSSFPAGGPANFSQPPPMPAEYMYGKRAWTSGQWVCVPDQNAAAMQGRQGRWWGDWGSKPSSREYWSTKLKENPLDLEGMDIRAPPPPEKPVAGTGDHHLRPRDENAADPNARKSWIWVPALSDNSTTSSSTAGDRSRHSRSRSSSQPPQERRPSSAEPPVPWAQPSPSAEFISASSKARPDGSRRGQSMRSSHQDYRPTQTGENAPYPSVNDETQQIPRYASADGYRRKRTVSASRSFQNANQNGQSSQQRPVHASSSNSRANGVQRSQTLPVELIHPQPQASFVREPQFAANGHRTNVDRYADRSEHVNGIYGRAPPPLQTTFSPGVIRTQQHYDSPVHSPVRERDDYRESDEGRKSDRIREWMANTERSAFVPQTRRTVDGTEHLSGSRSYDYIHSSKADPHRDLQRHSSMPTTISSSSTSTPVYAPQMQQQQSSSSGQMSDITEEPDDMAYKMAHMRLGHGHDVRDESPLRSRSGSRRTNTLERSATMPVVQESEHYVPRGSLDARVSRREFRDLAQEHASNRDASPTPASSRAQSRSHHHPSASTSSPHVHRAHDGTPVRPDYMYLTPDRPQPQPQSQTHHHYVNPSSSSSKASLGLPYSSTPKHSPLRSSETVSYRNTSSQPIVAPATPARGIYAYPEGSHASSPHTPTSQQQVRQRSGQQLDVEHHRRTPSRSPQGSRTPSPGPGPTSMPRGMPATAHSHVPVQQIYDTPTRHTPSRSVNMYSASPAGHSSRAPGRAPGASAVTPTSNSSARGASRHVRRGWWNRRGDHLTDDHRIVYCPPGRNYPKDLEDYPDLGFKDHLGNIRALGTDSRFEEHPDSIPKGGRPAVSPYEAFIEYVLTSK